MNANIKSNQIKNDLKGHGLECILRSSLYCVKFTFIFRPSDLITTLTYVLMDNFSPWFNSNGECVVFIILLFKKC